MTSITALKLIEKTETLEYFIRSILSSIMYSIVDSAIRELQWERIACPWNKGYWWTHQTGIASREIPIPDQPRQRKEHLSKEWRNLQANQIKYRAGYKPQWDQKRKQGNPATNKVKERRNREAKGCQKRTTFRMQQRRRPHVQDVLAGWFQRYRTQW